MHYAQFTPQIDLDQIYSILYIYTQSKQRWPLVEVVQLEFMRNTNCVDLYAAIPFALQKIVVWLKFTPL